MVLVAPGIVGDDGDYDDDCNVKKQRVASCINLYCSDPYAVQLIRIKAIITFLLRS